MKNKLMTMFSALMCGMMLLKTKVYAFGVNELNGTDIKNDNLTNTGERILGIVTTIGSVVAVLVLVVRGIKYMIGSTEEKAEYKKSMLPYVIGAVLLFSASAIASVIYNLAITL